MKISGIILLSFILLIVSCGASKNGNNGKRTVSYYHSIKCHAGIEVYFSHAKSYTADLDESKVEMSINDGVLELNRKENNSNDILKVYLTADKIEGIALSGGSMFISDEVKNERTVSFSASGGSIFDVKNIKAKESNIASSGGAIINIKDLKSEKVNIASSGGSISNINIKADNLNLSSSGGSITTLTGSTDNISVNSSGSANINITNLKYKNINKHSSGNGSIQE